MGDIVRNACFYYDCDNETDSLTVLREERAKHTKEVLDLQKKLSQINDVVNASMHPLIAGYEQQIADFKKQLHSLIKINIPGKSMNKDEEIKWRCNMETLITNCNFYGIKWEKEALETLQTVAEALLNLTKVFASTNVQIDCLLKCDTQGKPEIQGESQEKEQNSD
jgi:hypothetical protein